MKKEIKVVYGLIYDDELNKRMGLNRFYHLNGDIEIINNTNNSNKEN